MEAQLARFAVDVTEAAAKIQKVEGERDEYRKLVLHLREEVERLRRGLLGQKAERLPRDDGQLSLAILTLAMAGAGGAPEAEAAIEEELVAEHTRRKPVRKPPPADLPRVKIVLTPPEVEREPEAFEQIGSEVREVLERRPAATIVVQVEYLKFVRKEPKVGEPTRVVVVPALELPIERGTAGPGLLADTIVRRWQDHQPLNRLEGIYGREGLELSRSTICTWHEQLATLAAPVVEAMFADALAQPYVCVDATGVLVLAKDKCKNGHFWVLVAPERHVLYRYSRRHDSAAVDALLPDYRGYVVADAHNVYDHLYKQGAVEVGCWAHARRYWWQSFPTDPDRANVALAHIGALFKIERTIASSPKKKREEVRREKSKPVLDALFAWCELQKPRVLDESPVAAAIQYAENQKAALYRFLDDGRLPIHNNVSERSLRRQVLGRRNWLFLGSEDGAFANTTFVSLLASARLHGIEPVGYIRDLLCLLPSWPKQRALDLAPLNWATTAATEEVAVKLAANRFRQAVLASRA
jgi:transposase